MAMVQRDDALRSLIYRISPYPPAIQGLITLVLLAMFLAFFAFGDAVFTAERLVLPASLIGSLLLAAWLVPVRRLPAWAQLLYLTIQCALTTITRALVPIPAIDYVYIVIVLQAITLLRLWLWIPFAVGVWLVWSGAVIIDSASALAWLKSNLALAFPTTCAIIAAIVYARQQRRSDQVAQMLQQVQQRYDSLAIALRELQQRYTLEERQRLSQTLAADMLQALERTEHQINQTICQAQTSLARMQSALVQTRLAAAQTLEGLRSTIAALRRYEDRFTTEQTATVVPALREEAIVSSLSAKVLGWVLPGVFIALALALVLLQTPFSLRLLLEFSVFACALMVVYLCTQRAQHPLLVQLGLGGQALVVLSMAAATQSLSLLIGLLLVIWQLATRLTALQIAIFGLIGPPALGLFVLQSAPQSIALPELMLFSIAAMIVLGPLLFARRQLNRRRQNELQMASLSAEIDEQMTTARALAAAGERARMAREFHDELGSKLVLIHLQLQLAEDILADNPSYALEALEQGREQLRAAWQSMLSVVDAALPIDGPQIEPSLQQLVAHCARSAASEITLRIDGPLDYVSPQVACTIYRAAQEGLTNACKHAQAARIEVTLISETSYVQLTVSDDGCGLSPAHTGGFGLIGLRERAELLGGGFEAGPLPQGGFRLRMVLPIDNE
jgi:signal transduction histidine kinase